MGNTTVAESLLVEIKAEEYRKKGYKVTTQGSLDFFPGLRADLIVSKDGETKVIEVKSRSTLAVNPQIVELAKVLHTKPGWSFELLWVAEPQTLESPPDAETLASRLFIQKLTEAKSALESGFTEAAFLMAWSVGEAVIRALVEEEGYSLQKIPSTLSLLEQAEALDVVARDDYDALTQMYKHRNAIAHGYSTPDFREEMAVTLVETVSRIARNLQGTPMLETE